MSTYAQGTNVSQLLVSSTSPLDAKTGSLTGGDGWRRVVSIKGSLVPADQWFTLEVIAEENRIIVKVDGRTTADYRDPQWGFLSGYLTLYHQPSRGMGIQFRKIEIKELPSSKPVDGVTGNWKDLLEKRTYKDANDQVLRYRLLKPLDYDAQKKYPLVVFLHGAGERGDNNDAHLLFGVGEFARYENRAKYPCFLLAPQCPANQTWANLISIGDQHDLREKPSEAMRMTLELVVALQKDFSLDAKRLYVTGLSMGGYGTWDVICRRPEMFAAAVPIAGGGDETQAKKIAKMPIWVFHNGKDNTIKPAQSRNMVEALKKAGGDPKYTEYPDTGHHAWVKAYEDAAMFKWLFSQKRE